MSEYCRVLIRVYPPGNDRFIRADSLLKNLAKGLEPFDFPAGETTELMQLRDGSLLWNGQLIWQPKSSVVAKKAG